MFALHSDVYYSLIIVFAFCFILKISSICASISLAIECISVRLFIQCDSCSLTFQTIPRCAGEPPRGGGVGGGGGGGGGDGWSYPELHPMQIRHSDWSNKHLAIKAKL